MLSYAKKLARLRMIAYLCSTFKKMKATLRSCARHEPSAGDYEGYGKADCIDKQGVWRCLYR